MARARSEEAHNQEDAGTWREQAHDEAFDDAEDRPHARQEGEGMKRAALVPLAVACPACGARYGEQCTTAVKTLDAFDARHWSHLSRIDLAAKAK